MALFGKDKSDVKKKESAKDFTRKDIDDLRNEDSYLRTQLADKIKTVARDMEQCRETLTKKLELGLLKEIGTLIGRIIALEEKVRHAEQGYTGISADYRIQYETLKRLYAWDLQLESHIDELKQDVNLFQGAITSGNLDSKRKEMVNISDKLRIITELFEKRREAIPGLEVK
jgi:hypothetical protein